MNGPAAKRPHPAAGSPRRVRLAALLWLALAGAAGCGSSDVVRFHVIYSTDIKSYVDPCT